MPNKSSAVLDRFWVKVAPASSGCWEWISSLDPRGYGQFWFGRKGKVAAHRLSYELTRGRIPDGLVIDHLCRNPKCVNPDHLEPVTQRENVLRGVGETAINAKRTHCKRGHGFTAENTKIVKGFRQCRTCNGAARAGYRRRVKEKIAGVVR